MSDEREDRGVNLTALLSFFDEKPSWLTACVASLAKANVDHLIACDGAYLMYPNSLKQHRSSQAQLEAILGAAYGADIGVTLHVPSQPWHGNEVEKRNRMFDLGRQTNVDWFLIIDADEVIHTASPDLKQQLADTEECCAYYLLLEPTSRNYIRALYRNHPDLNVKQSHYGYHHGDRFIFDGSDEPAADLTDHLVLEHRNHERDHIRKLRALEYYRMRDDHGIETQPERTATSTTFVLEGKR